jgi:hypothetical protein
VNEAFAAVPAEHLNRHPQKVSVSFQVFPMVSSNLKIPVHQSFRHQVLYSSV